MFLKGIVRESFLKVMELTNGIGIMVVTVLFGGVYLLWKTGAEFHWKKVVLMVYVAIGFASLITQGSSSGIVAFVVMMFVLFGMSVKDSEKMECFWLEMVLFSGACLITYVLRKTNVFSQEVLQERMTDVLTFSMDCFHWSKRHTYNPVPHQRFYEKCECVKEVDPRLAALADLLIDE